MFVTGTRKRLRQLANLWIVGKCGQQPVHIPPRGVPVLLAQALSHPLHRVMNFLIFLTLAAQLDLFPQPRRLILITVAFCKMLNQRVGRLVIPLDQFFVDRQPQIAGIHTI